MADHFTILKNNIYGLRSNDKKLHLPNPKTIFLKSPFMYCAPKFLNNLPDNISILSLNSFKNVIEEYIYNSTQAIVFLYKIVNLYHVLYVVH